MSDNTELIKDLRWRDSLTLHKGVFGIAADALEAAEQTITQLHRAWATDAERLVAAQAKLTAARDAWSLIDRMGNRLQDRTALDRALDLSQSPVDALQAHDRQVAAKALTDARDELRKWAETNRPYTNMTQILGVQEAANIVGRRAAAIVSGGGE